MHARPVVNDANTREDFRENKEDVAWNILLQSENEDLPAFKQAYGLWQQRAEALNRCEELYTEAADLTDISSNSQ